MLEEADEGPQPEVTVRTAGSVATITLRRAHRHNTLVPEFIDELRQSFRAIGANSSVEAVVLTAEGSTFSTGGDVRGFWDHRDDLEGYARSTVGGLHALMVEMMGLPQPIVAAVGGMVTGGSIGLVLASDIVLVSPDATFTPWYAVVGFSPDGGWTALVPDLIGPARAADVLLANRTITAEEAVAWGLASRIVEAESLTAASTSLAEDIAGMRAGSRLHIKKLLHSDLDGVARRLAEEERRFIEQITTQEASDGMSTFLRIEA